MSRRAAAAWLACAALAAGCGGRTVQRASSETLTIGTAIPNAGDRSSGMGAVVKALTLEAPISISWEGRPAGKAFDRWEWLPGNLGLRLHLQPGIRFHDGTPLTSALAAGILHEAFIVQQSAMSATIVSVAAEGTDAVVIRTTQPEGFLLSDLSTVDFALPGHPRIGTGPFRYDSQGPPVVLQAFDGYRMGRPAIDTVKIVGYPTQRAAWAAMLRGETNMLHDVSREAVEFVEAESTVQTHSFVRGYYDALIFNQAHPVLRRREVRQALSEAVDRQEIVDLALRKRGSVAKGPFWPYHWALPADLPAYGFDRPAAIQRLERAGLPVLPSDGPSHMPARLRFGCLVVAEDQRLQRVALVLQRQLYDVGVDLDVQPIDYRSLVARMATGNFDSILIEPVSYRSSAFVYGLWHSPPPDAKVRLDAGSGYKAADAALDRFRRAVSDDEVRASIADVQRAIYDDPPAIFIDWTERTRALSRSIDVPEERGRDILGWIQRWKPSAPGVQASR